MLYHGQVGVADDAKPGKAILRVKIEPGKGYDSKPTEIAVLLEK